MVRPQLAKKGLAFGPHPAPFLATPLQIPIFARARRNAQESNPSVHTISLLYISKTFAQWLVCPN